MFGRNMLYINLNNVCRSMIHTLPFNPITNTGLHHCAATYLLFTKAGDFLIEFTNNLTSRGQLVLHVQ
jgi:hypothetical protein